jgi:agmatinase
MKVEYIDKTKAYEGCHAGFEEARTVLFGAGYDGTSSYRPGSRFAPTAIRSETYYAQEDYSPYFLKDLNDAYIHDLGDVEIIFGNKEETLSRIEAVASEIVRNEKVPVTIGGEHLISLPIVKAVLKRYPNLHVIQLDAHLDMMDQLFGERYSHGTVMRRIYDLMPEAGRIHQVGIRSGSFKEYEFSQIHARIYPFDTKIFTNHVEELHDFPVYLTVDLDVFDPSLIPGTGTPEAGGILFPEFIALLKDINKLNVVGADLVELAPQIDSTNVSTIVASKILREILLAISS